jgi:hypothetical protein
MARLRSGRDGHRLARFSGHRRTKKKLPPGQYLVHDFPVLSAGPTPRDGLRD